MLGKVIRQKWITRDDLKANPSTYYVFGDNMKRVGLGGQAKEMRGEPNAIGVPTKRSPGTWSGDYFHDSHLREGHEIPITIAVEFGRIRLALEQEHNVVIPIDGIGTGLSELPTRAPKIAAWIDSLIAELEKDFP